ncbi:uncharacterized protein METZ01_LOCUS207429 [marine metagenome]|uniref:GYF domain-containing protein n=1 Tax=marine metagenome TaxID=408172 RepID=A0A382EVS8_9ZZZZ
MSQQYKIKGTDGAEYGPVSTEELQQWIAQNRCTRDSLVEADGSGEWVPLATLPVFQSALAALAVPPPAPEQGDGGVSTVIPYKNVPALVGYYLAVFSGLGLLCPPAGFVLALPALILGIIGLKKVKANSEAKGTVHAWIGILGGAFFCIVFILMIVLRSPQFRPF